MKEQFHQIIVGMNLLEDENRGWNERSTFAYYGLEAPISIVGAWLDDRSVKVLVMDKNGRTAEVFTTMFRLEHSRK